MLDDQNSLPSQLETCAHDFRFAMQEARGLLLYSDPETIRKRPAPDQWSAIECVAHLNLSTQAMLPGIRQAIEAAPEKNGGPAAYRMDFLGRVLAWSLEPPPYLKFKTTAIAQPPETGETQAILEEFDRQHQELLGLLHQASNRQIDKQKLKSPFGNLQYNTFSALRIITAHDRRHLWQARKAVSPRRTTK